MYLVFIAESGEFAGAQESKLALQAVRDALVKVAELDSEVGFTASRFLPGGCEDLLKMIDDGQLGELT
jgi:hypothetical protein